MEKKEHPTSRWTTALKQWNQGRKELCGFLIPAKGTPEYAEVKALAKSLPNTDVKGSGGFIVEKTKILVKFE